VIAVAIAGVVATAPNVAHADADRDDWGMPAVALVDGIAARPAMGGPMAYGAGVAMSVLPKQCAYFSVNSGFSITPRDSRTRIDTMFLGGDFGIKTEHQNGDPLVLYAGVTVRVLSVSHYDTAARDRFTTLGIGATAGVMGDVPGSERMFYRLGVTALTAGAPDGVPNSSLGVQLGLGSRFSF
jgi:hypothetical protein